MRKFYRYKDGSRDWNQGGNNHSNLTFTSLNYMPEAILTEHFAYVTLPHCQYSPHSGVYLLQSMDESTLI